MRISNPFKGVMPETGMKSKGSKFWFIVPMILALWIGKEVFAGVFVGTVFVVFLMMSVEQLPGFWTIAQSTWGRLIVGVSTSLVLHKVMGGADTIMAITATGWAGMLKILVLTFEAKRLRLEKQARMAKVHERIERYQANPPIEAQWHRG